MADSSLFCPFCTAQSLEEPLLAHTDTVIAFRDIFPSAPGHILVVPRRHIGKLSQLTEEESSALWRTAMNLLSEQQATDSHMDFTVGVNDGVHAGQTIPHCHLHVIPRHAGDTPEPKGGIRWVIPSTAPYWKSNETSKRGKA